MAVEARLLPMRYRDPQRIGRGGMGEIYRATDDVLGRAVAVKLLDEAHSGDHGIRERFTREGLAAARLSGRPNVVTIFDVGEWQGRPFIVMEYLAGGSIEDELRDRRVPLGQALAWLEQAAVALDAAHAEGIVHRDVKPGNLLLDRDGNLHVADFGIASAAGMAALTYTGTVLGTASYLSPEQAQGERATPASDRYGLAVVAFELLAGERPFQADTAAAEAAAHVSAPVPAISERRPDLPRELDYVFARALAKVPEERYSSAAEFVAAVRDALHAGESRTQVLAAPSAATSRRPVWILPAMILLALLGGGLVLAALLVADDDQQARGETIVRTVTQRGETRKVTVTAESEPVTVTTTPEPEPAPDPDPAPPAAGLSVAQARALQDESTAAMNAGDWERALALAQQALPALEGRDTTYEGYASFNIGNSLAQLGRCEEALPYLDRREQLGGPHPAVDRARRLCA
jgi:eukaryotic-like serine/threonine-protein kinase